MRGARIGATLDGMRLGVAAALLLLALVAGRADAQSSRLYAYHGTGSWVSIYDGPAFARPENVAARLAAHHVRTLYLETGNDRQHADVTRPDRVARFIEAAHARGIRVVGWYVPGFVNTRRDLRRTVAGATFATPTGQGFDGFALDIEATKVRDIARRTARAVAYAVAVRRALGPRYPLGAITIDPVGARYWPGYPFAELSRSVDVFLPMTYFTARTAGPRRVRAYSTANIAAIRRLAGNPSFPVHPIGGDTHDASLAELRAFLAASSASSTLGASLWEYGRMTSAQWLLLARS